MKNINLILLSMLMAIAAGCSGDAAAVISQTEENEKNETGTKAMSESRIQTSKELPPIEYEPKMRKKPESVEEATQMIAQIRQLYDWSNVPPAMTQDLSLEKVYQYVKAMKLIKSQVPHDIKWLKSFTGNDLPGVDKFSAESVDRARGSALSRLESYLPRDMEHSLKYSREFIVGSFSERQWFAVDKAASVDMSDQSQIRNLLTRENLVTLREKQIKLIFEAFTAINLFDDAMEIESDWSKEQARFEAIVETYHEKLAQAADAIKPPKDLGDESLRKIAAEVLANKKYKLPKPERIIVNAPKKSHGKDHYTIDFGERSIEKSPYRWEEFQVATIEKEGNRHYLWYNTIMYYSVGPHTVPTEKWVLGPRHKSSPISASNINQ